MKKPSIHLDVVQKKISKALWAGAEHLLLSFMFLSVLAISITVLVWYWSLHLKGVGLELSETLFLQDTLLEIIEIQERRADAIDALSSKEYQDVFFPEQMID